MTNKSKKNQFKSVTHKTLDESITRRYIDLNHKFDVVDERMGIYMNIINKKVEPNGVHCVLKLITTTNRVRYITINTKPD